jgi:IS30 family transposase
MYAEERKERFRRKRTFTEVVRAKVIRKLTEEQWSPEQIVGRARREGLPMVSHERIYQYIRSDKKQGGTLSSSTPAQTPQTTGRRQESDDTRQGFHRLPAGYYQ